MKFKGLVCGVCGLFIVASILPHSCATPKISEEVYVQKAISKILLPPVIRMEIPDQPHIPENQYPTFQYNNVVALGTASLPTVPVRLIPLRNSGSA